MTESKEIPSWLNVLIILVTILYFVTMPLTFLIIPLYIVLSLIVVYYVIEFSDKKAFVKWVYSLIAAIFSPIFGALYILSRIINSNKPFI